MKDTKQKSYRKYKEKSYENLKERLDFLKGAVDCSYLLRSFGMEECHETSKEVRAACPIHKGDNKTAFRFNKETRTWVCFTHQCHETFGNDIIGLIKALTGKTFMESVEYLQELVGDTSSYDYISARHAKEMDEFMDSYSKKVVVKPKAVNEKSLSLYRGLRSGFFLGEGFTNETLDYFEVGGGWKDKQGLIRDIIPIRDDRAELIAYSLRDIRPNVSEDDKYIHTPGFDKQHCLYNLHKASKYADRLPLILVEGFKSVWRLHDYGINNVVASMGAKLTPGQQTLLCMHALNGVVVFYDNDLAGVNGANSAYSDLKNKLDIKLVFIQEVDEDGKGLDPADLSKEQVYDYLNTYFNLEV